MLNQMNRRMLSTFKSRLHFLLAVLFSMLLALLLAVAATAYADATFTVNWLPDDADVNPGDGHCDVDSILLLDQCSLRAAIQEANAHAGSDTIVFNVGGGGAQTLTFNSLLPTITEQVTIDGTTQPNCASYPCTILHGNDAGVSTTGLQISAGNSIVKGLVINGFATGIELVTNGGNHIEGNYIGTNLTGTAVISNDIGIRIEASSGNVIGGLTSGSRNLISGNNSGVWISGDAALTNTIEGNYIGTEINGTVALPNGVGVEIQDGPLNTIGGTTAAARNLISGNRYAGIAVNGTHASGNSVQGNYIGTDVTGLHALPNQTGVDLEYAFSNIIGGTSSGARNLISGNSGTGVVIVNADPVAGNYNSVIGNYIGTDIYGAATLPNLYGVGISSNRNTIDDNVIAGNLNAGVEIGHGAGNTISGNAIFSNAKLGIDLGNVGVAPNDPGDNDVGPNGLQNYPVLTSAISTSNAITVTAVLNSQPNTSFRIEVFANSACDDSAYGEGESYIGWLPVMTNADGNISFTSVFTYSTPTGQFLTATATDPGGNTSEFSKCRIVTAPTTGYLPLIER